eukprot:gnl/MRDRNA2_/MRDRNA2_239239_c0_seq1.p1 gnl/MRDRNA2_/MRDRNA2_239239_c0~~gnl/MRDRNA2_/MRDRNA2_239239_c0_seq1.p1  ORF type:complete len:148 (-),score=4.14 gnl/MRDRNA2_/MRDRNA2_239239_c0_seq1:178-621(-)
MFFDSGMCASCRNRKISERVAEIEVFVDAAISGERLAVVKISCNATVLQLGRAIQELTQNRSVKYNILFEGQKLEDLAPHWQGADGSWRTRRQLRIAASLTRWWCRRFVRVVRRPSQLPSDRAAVGTLTSRMVNLSLTGVVLIIMRM